MRIAIIANLTDLHSAYSPTSIIKNQIACLSRYGHKPILIVPEHFSVPDKERKRLDCLIWPVLPSFEEIDYARVDDLTTEHVTVVEKAAQTLTESLTDLDVVFTHDILPLPWNLPYAEALRLCAPSTRHTCFYHWVHSVPGADYDWWELARYGELNHQLVYQNRMDRERVAAVFRTGPENVRHVPPIADLRTYFDFEPDTWKIIDRYPGLIDADYAQVYPIAGNRLQAKGLTHLISVFGALQRKGFSICLLVADSNATGRREREDLTRWHRLAYSYGLPDSCFGFTSEFESPTYERGVPHEILRQLQQCTNLFVYPTEAESFGLVAPEFCLASGGLPVFNRSVSIMSEVSGATGLHCEFGGAERGLSKRGLRDVHEWIPDIIINRTRNDTSWMARQFDRQNYSIDAVYRNYYAPLLAERLLPE